MLKCGSGGPGAPPVARACARPVRARAPSHTPCCAEEQRTQALPSNHVTEPKPEPEVLPVVASGGTWRAALRGGCCPRRLTEATRASRRPQPARGHSGEAAPPARGPLCRPHKHTLTHSAVLARIRVHENDPSQRTSRRRQPVPRSAAQFTARRRACSL